MARGSQRGGAADLELSRAGPYPCEQGFRTPRDRDRPAPAEDLHKSYTLSSWRPIRALSLRGSTGAQNSAVVLPVRPAPEFQPCAGPVEPRRQLPWVSAAGCRGRTLRSARPRPDHPAKISTPIPSGTHAHGSNHAAGRSPVGDPGPLRTNAKSPPPRQVVPGWRAPRRAARGNEVAPGRAARTPVRRLRAGAGRRPLDTPGSPWAHASLRSGPRSGPAEGAQMKGMQSAVTMYFPSINCTTRLHRPQPQSEPKGQVPATLGNG